MKDIISILLLIGMVWCCFAFFSAAFLKSKQDKPEHWVNKRLPGKKSKKK